MSAIELFASLYDFLVSLPEPIKAIIQIIIVIIIAFIFDKIIVRYIRKAEKRLKLDPNVTNAVILIFRFFLIIGALSAISAISGLPPELFISLSAVLGAALGFASAETIGNFIAGIYLLISKPFDIGDFVKIKDIEGIVKEITVNYTKVITADGKTVLFSNRDVLKTSIVVYERKEDIYNYPIEIVFSSTRKKDEIEEILFSLLNKFKSEGKIIDGRFYLIELKKLEKKYVIILTVDNAEKLFVIPSEFLSELAGALE